MSKVILGKVPRRTAPTSVVRSPTEAGAASTLTDKVTYTYNEGSGPTTTHDWKIPPDAGAGDVVFGFISVHDGTGSNSGVDTVPAGWTLEASANDGNSVSGITAYYYLYSRTLDGTEAYTGDTFTTDADSNVVATWWGVRTGGSTPTITVVGPGGAPAFDAAAAPSPGDYWCFALAGYNKGAPTPDVATGGPTGYDLLSWLSTTGLGTGLGAKQYLHSAFKALTTTETPPVYSWNDTAGTRYYASFTMLVSGGGSDPTVAAYDHDHVEADITDLDHWTEADHDALDHTGLTGVGASDHGGLSGLTDDDHTQYSLADGTRAFTGTVSGVTPTLSAHLATKGYVDSNSSAYYEVIVSGSAPPVAVTNEAADDWVYGEVT